MKSQWAARGQSVRRTNNTAQVMIRARPHELFNIHDAPSCLLCAFIAQIPVSWLLPENLFLSVYR